ncbi:putative serine protease [alpha proteobacterium BAL199]|jgi:S1-C subfamily serine protease|nr:putative serine protease [alpha proteobacterium BAL199]
MVARFLIKTAAAGLAAVLGMGAIGDVPARAADRPEASVVMVEAHVPADARSAATLGPMRRGSGIVIDKGGLILTIGYLVLEADRVQVADATGREVPAEIVAYDHETGFGLLRAGGPLRATPARLGSASVMAAGQPATAAAPGVVAPAIIVARRSFAGGWEYLLEDALFTTPPIPNFGGAGLFDSEGRLVGIGSLIVGDTVGDGTGPPGNMFVPIDLLPPILADLLAFGRATAPAVPWLGLYPEPTRGVLMISRVSPGGPADRAGIVPGEVIVGLGEEPIGQLDTLWRRVRALGPAGVDVPLRILSRGGVRDVTLKSRDRRDWLRLERTY